MAGFEPRAPVRGEVMCRHCGSKGTGWDGKVPEGWRARAIGHFDCPDCIKPCDQGTAPNP
jgi:hypothetical protein